MSRIYISSTFSDLRTHREKVRSALRRMGHEDVAMEYYGASDERPLDRCLRDVEASELYVGIFAWRYGFIPEGMDKSITELEYRRAVETGKECLIFLIGEDAPWPVSKMELGAMGKINALRQELSENHVVDFFTTEDDLKAGVSQAVSNWDKARGGSSGKEATDWDDYRAKVYQDHQWVRLTVIAGAKHDQIARIPLTEVFVPQTAKPGLPTFEIPDEVLKFKRSLFTPGAPSQRPPSPGTEPTAEASEEADDAASLADSFPEPVFGVLGRERTQVILGGPGSGKSSLLHYAVLNLCAPEQQDNPLLPGLDQRPVPFLIELRQYVLKKSPGFIEYIVSNSKERYGVDIDAEGILALLKQGCGALVMFDGLDEVFAPDERASVIQQFKTFARQHPLARVVVTSRIVGYDSSELGVEGFEHYTLLDFSLQQIRDFVPRWYLYYTWEGDLRDAAGLVQRILDSPRLLELAGNPLLLTMMAIIYKHQDLPEQRWKLYERCTEVLLEDWDLKRKNIERRQLLPADVNIIAHQKSEILQLVSMYMLEHGQAGRELNAIAYQPLMAILARYLEQKFGKSAGDAEAIARDILHHLRERTYILAEVGEGIFGFVHRTFMEYFAASYHQAQFNARRADYGWLTEDVFGKYWQRDEWQEVLLLLIAMLAGQGSPVQEVVNYLRTNYQDDPPFNLAFAASCLAESGSVEDEKYAQGVVDEMVDAVISHARRGEEPQVDKFIDAGLTALSMLGTMITVPGPVKKKIGALKKKSVAMRGKMIAWQMGLALRPAKDRLSFALSALGDKNQVLRRGAIAALERGWPENTEVESALLDVVENDHVIKVSQMAALALRNSWPNSTKVLDAIEQLLNNRESKDAAIATIKLLAANWAGNGRALTIITNLFQQYPESPYYGKNTALQRVAVEAIIKGWGKDNKAISFILSVAQDSSQDRLTRITAIITLAKNWPDLPDTLPLLLDRAANDSHPEVRSTCVLLLVGAREDVQDSLWYYLQPDSFQFIPYVLPPSILLNDKRGWRDHPDVFNLLFRIARTDQDKSLRLLAFTILVEGWRDDPQVRALSHPDPYTWLPPGPPMM